MHKKTMKMAEAIKILNSKKGFMVSFEKKENGALIADYFPDKRLGEKLIATEKQAWKLATRFAEATSGDGKYVNIYVVDSNFFPVEGYEDKKMFRRLGRY